MKIERAHREELPLFFGQQFRQYGFPEGMNAALVGELTIIIAAGMQRHMCITDIMPDIRRQFQDSGRLLFP